MSLIDDNSEECCTSPLEWFKIMPTQTTIEKSIDVEQQSLTSLRDGATIEFYVAASNDEYIDLENSRLYVKCKVTRDDGTPLQAADVVAPINGLFNSLWKNVELDLSNKLISHSSNMHGYVSMISHLIHDSEESAESERAMQLLYKDTPSQMDAIECRRSNSAGVIAGFDMVEGADGAFAMVADDAALGNNGLYKRYMMTRLSQSVEMLGPLRIDIAEQERYLPNGVSMKLRFHRQKNSFLLMAAEESTFKVVVEECCLLVRKVKPSPGVFVGHQEALSKQPAKYPITRKECKSITVPTGLRSVKRDNLFLGQLPKRVVVAMVDSAAAAGAYNRNPYNFKTFNINHIQLYTDGEPVHAQPLTPDLAKNSYLQCYESLYRGLNRLDGEKSNIIKRVDWDKGYALFAFDLTPDMDAEDHYSLIKHGNLRLEINFSTDLPNPIDVLMYAEFDNIIEITNERNVQHDYT